MTAPTINGTRYPQPVEDLLPAARALELPEGQKLPSRNRLMREFHIGAPKADALRALLLNEGFRRDLDQAVRDGRLTRPGTRPRTDKPAPVTFDYPEPIGPDPAPVPAVPESAPPTEPDSTPAPPVPAAEPTAQVAKDGHPGTKITTNAPGWRTGGRGWAYAGVILGGVVSIAANVAHTYLPKPPPDAPAGWMPAPDWSPSPLAVAFSVFWPVALFVAVEILTRIPWGDGLGSVIARVVGVLPVALVAAVVSYRHLAGLLEHFGEDPLTVAIGPLAVDGLMVMASAALLATGRRKSG